MARIDTPSHTPSCCQYILSLTGIAAGIIILLSGVFAFCAIKGFLPHNASHLKKFALIGLVNSYFVMASGSILAILSSAALVHVFYKAGAAVATR